METRCKVQCDFKDNEKVQLHPVYDEDPNSENGKFFEATPWGTIELGIVNKAALDQFEVGKHYYVDFTKAE